MPEGPESLLGRRAPFEESMWSYLYLFGKVCERFCSICAVRHFKIRQHTSVPGMVYEYCLVCVLQSDSVKDWYK